MANVWWRGYKWAAAWLDLGDERMGRHTLPGYQALECRVFLSFLSKKDYASGCLSGQLSQTNVYQDTACGNPSALIDHCTAWMERKRGKKGEKTLAKW